MSPQSNQPEPAQGNSADNPLAPPDDFGASVIAAFEKRQVANIAPAGGGDAVGGGDGPPGGWPANEDAPTFTPPATTTPATTPATTPETSGAATGEGAPASITDDAGAAPATTTPAEPAATTPAATTQPPEDGGASVAAEVPEPPATPSGYTYQYTDAAGQAAEYQFTDAEVHRALGLAQWAGSLAEEVRTAIGAIETGQAVAIPRADYDQFMAWRGQQNRTTRDADLSGLDLDEGVAKLISSLRDEVDTLKGQPQAPQAPVPTQQDIAQLNADAAAYQSAMTTYGQSRGLTAEEVEGLMNVAIRANIIPNLVEAGSYYNPANGQLLARADLGAVTEQALDWALIQNPGLKTRVLTAQQQATTATTPPAPDSVAAKKARAASVATAASGAPAPSAPAVREMSNDQRVAAMAKEIEAALAAAS